MSIGRYPADYGFIKMPGGLIEVDSFVRHAEGNGVGAVVELLYGKVACLVKKGERIDTAKV